VQAVTLSDVTASNHDVGVSTTDGAGTTSVVLLVEGMHCGSCSALIEETLQEQAGVTGATVDLESARAVVDFDPSAIDVHALTAAVAEAGYAATPAG
jgi:Cu+-exporting ATPase